MPNKERQKKALKDWIRAEGGYQPEPLIGDHEQITPPNAGSNVRVPEKSVEVKNKTFDSVDSCLRTLMSKPYVQEAEFDHKRCVYTITMSNGFMYESADLEGWYKKGSCAREAQEPWETVKAEFLAQATLMKGLMDNPYGDLPPTQQKIHEIMGAMKDLLLYKNQKYGDSAINPKKIFYKGDSTNSILIRLDDKIGRVMSNTEEKPRINDVCDIIGYCVLLLISMGVTSDDIAKFKD